MVRSQDNFYGALDSSSELSLRQEMINTLEGKFPEVAKAMSIIIRKPKRDASGDPIKCSCVDGVTREPDKDTLCPICFGMGYPFNEILSKTYMVLPPAFSDIGVHNKMNTRTPGRIYTPAAVFYFTYDADIQPIDRIVEIALDTEGEIVRPIKRTMIWNINEVVTFRADNGRIEYIKVYTDKADIRYLP